MSCCGCHARKAVLERLDWIFDFGCWLAPGDSLVDVTANADSGFLWEVLPLIEGDRVRVWLSGGLADETYTVTVRVTTAQGRVKTECLTLRVASPARAYEWTSPAFLNNWADRIFKDCRLGY